MLLAITAPAANVLRISSCHSWHHHEFGRVHHRPQRVFEALPERRFRRAVGCSPKRSFFLPMRIKLASALKWFDQETRLSLLPASSPAPRPLRRRRPA